MTYMHATSNNVVQVVITRIERRRLNERVSPIAPISSYFRFIACAKE